MDIRNITPHPEQPRKAFDEEALRHLSESLKKFGQLLPIRVRWNEGLGKWVIINGERRYRAALAAGMEAVTCHFVEEELTGSRILEEQVVENCLREDLGPVEQARAFRALYGGKLLVGAEGGRRAPPLQQHGGQGSCAPQAPAGDSGAD
jgi:ParB family chromosome partitioning protein